MKDKNGIENKRIAAPPENKQVVAALRTVRVRVKPGRVVAGLGDAGTEHEVDAKTAMRLARIGYVEILDK